MNDDDVIDELLSDFTELGNRVRTYNEAKYRRDTWVDNANKRYFYTYVSANVEGKTIEIPLCVRERFTPLIQEALVAWAEEELGKAQANLRAVEVHNLVAPPVPGGDITRRTRSIQIPEEAMEHHERS